MEMSAFSIETKKETFLSVVGDPGKHHPRRVMFQARKVQKVSFQCVPLLSFFGLDVLQDISLFPGNRCD